MALRDPQDVLTIDPMVMNIVNKIAAGCRLDGQLSFNGGVLVQGHLSGDIDIEGHLIVWTGACVSGRIRVKQNLYLFGQLGLPDDGKATTLECQDQAFIAKTGVSIATLLAKRLQLYEGADLQGAFKTLKQGNELPVLSDAYNQNQT